ncbi:MAG: T9SS type A sorting domain-containing protein [Bacteroidetes bacterium]|nr:T9SS type A sorting domain-containing protein [Bacteroidota bacterium]
MKKIIVISVFATVIVFAQGPNPYSFFPSSVGNVWEYSTTGGLERYEIISTSVDSMGNKIIFFNHGTYVLDTLLHVYKYPFSLNWLYYKLDADSGESWIVQTNINNQDTTYTLAKVTEKFPALVFGDTTIVMGIRYYLQQRDTIIDSVDESYPGQSWIDYLAAGIGLIEQWDIELGPTMVLRGCIIDGDTLGYITSIQNNSDMPLTYKLYQNYPNPFNPITKIRYTLAKPDYVRIIVYSILGKEVKVLIDKYQSSGEHEVEFNAENLPSGVYIYSLISSRFSSHRKMIYLK